jgi:fatty-acyl-CoA synthase
MAPELWTTTTASRSGAPPVQRMLADAFRRFATDPCLVWEDGFATFAETRARTAALASWLIANVRDTRHVSIVLPNGRAYLEAILACTLGNVVRVPLSVKEPHDVIVAKLTESQAEVLICTPEVADALAPWAKDAGAAVLVAGPEFEQVCAAPAKEIPLAAETDRYRLSFTGGTTGIPKAVVQTHRQERAMIRNLLMETIRPGRGTTFLAATPLAHASGAFILPTLLWGGSFSWLTQFDAGRVANSSWLCPDAGTTKVETFVVPTALADLTAAAKGGHQLGSVVYGGAPCPAPVLSAAIDTLGTDRLIQVYGQAEAPVTICVASVADHAAGRVVDGWVGYPFRFVDVSIDAGPGAANPSVGEVVVHGEHVMQGYWGRPEESAERLDADGGLHTGDIGRLDDAGGLRIVGRAREMVISGGFNVYPDDVERRLRQHGLDDIAFSVFAVPHERWGEAVVLAAGRDASGDEDGQRQRVAAAADEALAYYERPKQVFLMDELPLTSVGKVARQDLARQFGSQFAGDAKKGST